MLKDTCVNTSTPKQTANDENDYDYDDNNDDQNHELIFTF